MDKKKHDLIEHTAGFSGIPMARIKGSRIRVSDIAFQYMQLEQETPAERIQRAYPFLSIEEIEAALAYWREHEDEIAEEIAADEAAIEELEAHGPIRPQ